MCLNWLNSLNDVWTGNGENTDRGLLMLEIISTELAELLKESPPDSAQWTKTTRRTKYLNILSIFNCLIDYPMSFYTKNIFLNAVAKLPMKSR